MKLDSSKPCTCNNGGEATCLRHIPEPGCGNMLNYLNYILCPKCFDRMPSPKEEKSCAHGCNIGITCVACKAIRIASDEPYWSCLGSISESGCAGANAPFTTERGFCLVCDSSVPRLDRAHIVWGLDHFTCVERETLKFTTPFKIGERVRTVAGHPYGALGGVVVRHNGKQLIVADDEGNTTPWMPESLERET